jgi:hypothetical protein
MIDVSKCFDRFVVRFESSQMDFFYDKNIEVFQYIY